MGTRAIITQNGKPLIATHWDGYPESLGEDLKKMPDLSTDSIIKASEEHSIDFIDNSIGEQVTLSRLNTIAKKHNISIDEVKQGYRRGGVISSDDYEIGDIKIYDDFAEYQYDIRNNAIYWREVSGCWRTRKVDDNWTLLKQF